MSAPTFLAVPVGVLLRDRGWTHDDLAKRMADIGYPVTGDGTISNITACRRKSPRGRRAIALALGLHPADLHEVRIAGEDDDDGTPDAA